MFLSKNNRKWLILFKINDKNLFSSKWIYLKYTYLNEVDALSKYIQIKTFLLNFHDSYFILFY